MPRAVAGHIVDVADNGDLKVSLSPSRVAEVGERFTVLNEREKPIAEIKVVRADSSEIVARHFEPFVSDAALRASTGSGAGAVIGGILGSLIFPGAGTAIAAAMGTALGSALRHRSPTEPILSGMAIVPIAISDDSVEVRGSDPSATSSHREDQTG
jgi:hypothetical protein